MKKWTRLAEAKTPDGQDLTLWDRDGERVIRVGTAELMSTRQHSSEERLAELCCERAKSVAKAKVLIGGLGFGYTLAATLKLLADDATVTVAELMPCVVAWNQDPSLALPGLKPLEDPRVHLIERDVGLVIDKNPGGFDAIMLDVDNGPAALATAGNARLYDDTGLYRVRGALRKGGIVGFWSAAANPQFAKRLGKAGFKVDIDVARAHAEGRSGMGGGSRHNLFIGRT